MTQSPLIPLLGSNTKATIIQTLTEKQPQTLKELHNNLQKKLNKPITYQATHKTITEMTNEEILKKTGREITINEEWVEKISLIAESIKDSKINKTKEKIRTENYEFETFVDMGKFVIKFLYEIPNPKNKPSFCILNHSWPVVGFDKTDYLRFTETLKKAPFFEFISQDTPLDNLFAETFNKMGKKIFFTKERAVPTDTIVRDSCVIQIMYTNEFLKEYHSIFEKSKEEKSIQIGDVLFNFLIKKTKINITIIWNEELADKIITESLSRINKQKGE